MINLSSNARQILKARYLRNTDVTETPTDLFERVARHIASVENENKDLWFDRFYKVMRNLEFLPNSPTLMNAGLPNGQLSACFVLPVEDNLNAIFTTLKNAALIHHNGGGTGYNFSKIRPKDDFISSSEGSSAGPVSFMKIYDTATEYVKQAGKRRGANMGILNINHSDIEEFISSKSDFKSLQNFNISVGITNDFMYALENDIDWQLVNPRTNKVSKTLSAKKLWDSIIEQALKTGDPGLIFLDTINQNNPLNKLGEIQSTNPCGEVPLFNYESCNLGSINLKKMVVQNSTNIEIDWKKLERTITTAIRILDNVISCNYFVLSQIQEITLANRKIGLGVMGWAELLIMLEIPYASNKAVELAETVMKFIHEKSYNASQLLAKKRGCFPSWKQSSFAPHMLLRNATCNSIAPTGSISIIADTSYAIEPLYALAYKRTGILENTTQMEINATFVDKMKSLGLWSEQLRSEIIEKGSIQHVKNIPTHLKNLFKTSLEISWKYHLLHQRAFQRYTDNAVSKTINLPNTTTFEEVSEIYKTAWKYKLKGITIYRNGSRNNQILQLCGYNKEDICN
ncbi:adenosylcobalamin-dependent ribonucleoside-diphosphate reductase [Maribacter confluentis]|uniref:Vitamin B12-dependent ribonucleotide reductase n=1 Tax=Maribacter confluentis TaxID=1656093 RepID=A0ABT8RUX6_9FLAO|nr:adenosylcobalamin-dependent ribonucleoside-diphosphate reductase [Maribacter confluentis]MDO1513886.1 adenosylcobalamin-dependent ribonucleoside-diphosphate reductase [Maribacter confluentis]